MDRDVAQAKKAYNLEEQKIAGLKVQISQLNQSIAVQRNKKKYYSNQLQFNQKNAQLELTKIKQQLSSRKQGLDISLEQLNKDRSLFQKDLISENQFKEKEQGYLKEKEAYTTLVNHYRQEANKKQNLGENYDDQLNDYELDILKSESRKSELTLQLSESKIRLSQLQNQLDFGKKEAGKLYILADKDGFIANLYNQRIATNFLAKEAPILDVVPAKEQSFYAKLDIPESAIKDVVVGQTAHLKLKAYHYLQYGILKGKVTFINKDATNDFYVLADIVEQQETIQLKGGFKVKGDIIIKKVPLYQFVFHKLFIK